MSFWKKKPEQSDVTTPVVESSRNWAVTGGSQTETSSGREDAPASVKPVQQVTAADILERRFGTIRSALGSGTNIQGKLNFDVPVRIDGELGGEIYSSQPVIVGPSAKIHASIEAATLIILGTVEGDVIATDRVEIFKGGSLNGSVQSPVFVLEEDGLFNGKIEMPRNSSVKKKLAAG